MSEHFFDTYRKGQKKLSATNFNRMVDSLQDMQGRTADRFKTSDLNQMFVRNDTGSDIVEAYGVLEVADITPDLTTNDGMSVFKRKVLVSGNTPSIEAGYTPDSYNRAVVLQGPALKNRYAKGIIYGPAQVKIDMVNDAHKWARLKDGDVTQLQSDVTGTCYIIDVQSGTGTKWALVIMNAHHHAGSGNPLLSLGSGWDLQNQGTEGGEPATGVKITVST